MNIGSKLKGGALYVAIIISFIISIILGLCIVLAYYSSQSIQTQNSSTQLNLSLESAFTISHSKFYHPQLNSRWQPISFNNDSVLIKQMPWGCYTLISCKAKNNHYTISKTGLFGTFASTDTALIINQNNKAIGVAGKIKFNAYCYLPTLGIKMANINGSYVSNTNTLLPFIKQAPNDITEIDDFFLQSINNCFEANNEKTDSLLPSLPDLLEQSFENKTAVLKTESVILNTHHLSGNIKIIAANCITVYNTSLLNDVFLIARKIIFKKGFKGTVQVLAKDSIITEDDCEFKYPSSFCVYDKYDATNDFKLSKGVFFGYNCSFNGSILGYNKPHTSSMIISLNTNFKMIGNMYCSNFINLRGNIYGTVYCRNLLVQTPAAVYENHIFNCLIDPKKYGHCLTVPDWFNHYNNPITCAKWF